MNLLAFTDIHGAYGNFAAIKSELGAADLIILAGDITHFGHGAEIRELLPRINPDNKAFYGVHGNCDYPDVLDQLEEQGISLHQRVQYENNLVLIGLGGSLPCPGRTPSEYSEKQYRETIESLPEIDRADKILVLVSHQPPYGTRNDVVMSGQHVGSRVIRDFVEELQPDLCITGHIHEGRGTDQIGPTKIVNPGPMRNGYYLAADINKVHINFELRSMKSSY